MLAPTIRRAAGILDGEPLSTRQARLRSRIARHVPAESQRRITEFMGELIGAPFDDSDSVELRAARREPMLMGDQVRDAWEDWIAAECARQPLILVLEDLHWGDLPTIRLVSAALRHVKDGPLLVIGLARPEVDARFPNLWAERDRQVLLLGELTRRATEKIAREVLGDSLDAATVGRLVERAGGNALYLEELIRAVAAGRGGDLVRGRGARIGRRTRAIARNGTIAAVTTAE
jgi:predicted ATPase